MKQLLSARFILPLFFLVTFCIGLFLRAVNNSVFLFYPDAYQNLLVAENIRTYHSVIGTLGKGGMLYPDFIAWTRPGYSLLIAGVNIFANNLLISGRIVSFSCSVLAIPVSFLFLKNVFKSSQIGMFGVILLTISFEHVVWTGFVQTEALGILLVMAIFALIFRNLSGNYSIGNIKDIIVGGILGFAILTRYEYLLLVVPIGMLLWQNSPNKIFRIITIFSSCFFVDSLIVSVLFPIKFITLFISQTYPIGVKIAVITSAIFILLLLTKRLLRISRILIIIQYIFLTFLGVGEISIVLLPLFYPQINIFSAFQKFLLHDFFIHIFFWIGLLLFIRKQKQKLFFVTGISLILLGGAYAGINSSIERYMTHLLPFFLIPATYGFYKSFSYGIHSAKWVRILTIFFIISFGIFQLVFTFFGIRLWGNGEWFETSYEEEGALKIAQHNILSTDVLVASYPEPYYFFTKIPTYSLTDKYPYIYIADISSNRNVILVVDRGMTYLFPNFTKIAEKKLSLYKKESFTVQRIFHYGAYSDTGKNIITIYHVPLRKLKEIINNSHSASYL